jgi:hypothetical protein
MLGRGFFVLSNFGRPDGCVSTHTFGEIQDEFSGFIGIAYLEVFVFYNEGDVDFCIGFEKTFFELFFKMF